MFNTHFPQKVGSREKMNGQAEKQVPTLPFTQPTENYCLVMFSFHMEDYARISFVCA